jgi:hypothetical protein
MPRSNSTNDRIQSVNELVGAFQKQDTSKQPKPENAKSAGLFRALLALAKRNERSLFASVFCLFFLSGLAIYSIKFIQVQRLNDDIRRAAMLEKLSGNYCASATLWENAIKRAERIKAPADIKAQLYYSLANAIVPSFAAVSGNNVPALDDCSILTGYSAATQVNYDRFDSFFDVDLGHALRNRAINLYNKALSYYANSASAPDQILAFAIFQRIQYLTRLNETLPTQALIDRWNQQIESAWLTDNLHEVISLCDSMITKTKKNTPALSAKAKALYRLSRRESEPQVKLLCFQNTR